MPRLALSLALVSLVATLAACRRAEGPAERYRAFAAAARTGALAPDPGTHAAAAAALWEMLSRESQARLQARADAVRSQAPDVVSASAKQLVLGDLAANVRRPTSVVVVRESADAAVVSVETEGGGPAREVSLVREEGAWRVVVPFDN